MVKYCMSCGKENDDAAVFCAFCGRRFPNQSAQPTEAEVPAMSATSTPPVTVLRFSLSHGEHKFILGEVNFTDETGRVVYGASRESALHENYTLSSEGRKLLFMKHKIHIGGFAFEMQDETGSPVGEIHCSVGARKGVLPGYSYKDVQGNSQAVVAWEQGILRFAILDPSHSQVYAEAWVDLPGGVVADIKAMGHKVYNLSIPQGSPLPLPVTLAFCVAIANIPPS